MATDRKHIAVYLAPEVEQALISFCEQKRLISKKGIMYSAGVNAALAQFFEIASAEKSNTPSDSSNTPNESSSIPTKSDNIPSNIPSEVFAVEVMPGKPEPGDGEVELLRQELEALKAERNTPQHKLYTEIEELKERNRLLLIKSRDERQSLQEKISALKYRDESQSRRLQEKQARLDELETQLEAERASREEIEAELFALKQTSATASKAFPNPGDLLNQLKAKRKKSKCDLADVETILDMLGSLSP
jgi:DNA repair exonuclease SbcCD ATPase subunit